MSPRGRHASASTYRRRRVLVAVVASAVLALIGFGIASLAGGRGPSKAPVTSTTAARVATTTTPKPASSVSMSFVGDTMLGTTPDLPPNPTTYLQAVMPALAAPTVFGNLEGTLTDSGDDSKCGTDSTECYAFRNPTSYAQDVFKAAGFTVMNSANNHSHDFGAQGAASTTTALQAAGIVQAGLPGQIGITQQGTTKIAFVDFAPYSNTNNMLDFAAAQTLIAQAKAEANVVVVYMHAGAEGADADHVTGQEETYVGEDRGNAEAFAHAAIDDGANLVVASGPHVLRGMQWYKGDLIAYSLGNFAGYQNFATSGDLDLSVILHVTMSGTGAIESAHVDSLLLNGDAEPAVDSSGQAASFVNQLSAGDFGLAAAHIDANGDVAVPAS
jgi:poly-gamma-glutamate capsule biosynthesis protein CapA/YwtB (metallophosphatase superfamily)